MLLQAKDKADYRRGRIITPPSLRLYRNNSRKPPRLRLVILYQKGENIEMSRDWEDFPGWRGLSPLVCFRVTERVLIDKEGSMKP